MRYYKCLNQQIYTNNEYSLVPIRHEHRFDIMKWRNEQIYHLRQSELLNIETQNTYFEEVVSGLFEQEQPDQILFSLLKREEFIGYGGLVHINWVDKNAEISFVMNTSLEGEGFARNWSEFLDLVERVAFTQLEFRKLYVYAFDLRPHLYSVLENKSYFLDARLKEHCYFNGSYKDVVIYSKLDNENSNISR